MNNLLNESSECCYSPENCCDGYLSEMPEVGGEFVATSSISISFPNSATDYESNSGVTVRQLSSFDGVLTSQCASAEVVWQDASGVVPAWNGSGPCVDSLTESVDVHGVPRIDLLNISPVKSMGSKRVNDCELISGGLDLGHHQDEMVAVPEKCEPGQESDSTRCESLIDLCDGKSAKKEIVGTSKDKIALGSNLMAIGHIARITSREVAA